MMEDTAVTVYRHKDGSSLSGWPNLERLVIVTKYNFTSPVKALGVTER